MRYRKKMKDGIFPPEIMPLAIPGKAWVRQEFVLFQEKQVVPTSHVYTSGLIFKAREVIIPLYTSFANLTLGTTVQSFLSFDYKRNNNIDKLQRTYK